MPATTPCPHCGVIGFVRKEHVIKANDAYMRFYCGCCNGAWSVNDSRDKRPVPSGTPEKPDRSRP